MMYPTYVEPSIQIQRSVHPKSKFTDWFTYSILNRSLGTTACAPSEESDQQSLQSSMWVAKQPKRLQVDSEDSDFFILSVTWHGSHLCVNSVNPLKTE